MPGQIYRPCYKKTPPSILFSQFVSHGYIFLFFSSHALVVLLQLFQRLAVNNNNAFVAGNVCMVTPGNFVIPFSFEQVEILGADQTVDFKLFLKSFVELNQLCEEQHSRTFCTELCRRKNDSWEQAYTFLSVVSLIMQAGLNIWHIQAAKIQSCRPILSVSHCSALECSEYTVEKQCVRTYVSFKLGGLFPSFWYRCINYLESLDIGYK